MGLYGKKRILALLNNTTDSHETDEIMQLLHANMSNSIPVRITQEGLAFLNSVFNGRLKNYFNQSIKQIESVKYVMFHGLIGICVARYLSERVYNNITYLPNTWLTGDLYFAYDPSQGLFYMTQKDIYVEKKFDHDDALEEILSNKFGPYKVLSPSILLNVMGYSYMANIRAEIQDDLVKATFLRKCHSKPQMKNELRKIYHIEFTDEESEILNGVDVRRLGVVHEIINNAIERSRKSSITDCVHKFSSDESGINVSLTKEQANILVGLIDCFTDEHEQDYIIDDNGSVRGTSDNKVYTLQEHLKKFLDKKQLDY